MPSDNYRQWTPDVFVSYDVTDSDAKSFTSILFAKLKQVGIGFRDSRKRTDALLDPIYQARFALVVFSKNDANSGQRLEELVDILLRRGNSKYPRLVVIPIFYGTVPAEVMESGATDKFRNALRSLPEDERDEKKKDGWGRALAEVEGIPGYDLANGIDSKLIKTIVKHLVNEIRSLYSFKVFGPFGGSGEKPWHSGEIKGIQILYTEFIKSVTFKVDPSTSNHEHEGKNDGKEPYEVKLNTGEDIISFHGHFQEARGGRIKFKALRFRTTQRQGLGVGLICEGGEGYFSVPLPSGAGKVLEFFGSKSRDGFLTSIGARVELTREVSCPPGLFGDKIGVPWKAKRPAPVKGIRARRASSGSRCIRSIAFRFDDDEGWWPPGSDEIWHMEFAINGSGEYLSSISGYYTCDGITSLTFLTNKKSATTIGDGMGTHFSSPETGYEIVGFKGWSDKHLYGIGAYFKPISDTLPAKSIGPFGEVIAWDDGKFKGVKEICLANKDGIRYIEIVYDDGSKEGHTAIHGDSTEDFSGYKQTVKLNYPQEYLISISGYTREDGCIGSLTFCSNRKIKTVGRKKGNYFWYPSNKSRIVGFYGTCGKSLNSIGVHEEPIPRWKSSKYKPNGFPGSDYINWDDEEHSNVVGYRVTVMGSSPEKLKIESITFMYENNGSLVEGPRHGGGDPSSGDWVMLDYPKDRLKGMKGYWRTEDNDTIIHDLTIFTTINNWPYAQRGDLNSNSASAPTSNPKSEPTSGNFTIPEELEKQPEQDRRIVGFFGRANKCLNLIGVRLEP